MSHRIVVSIVPLFLACILYAWGQGDDWTMPDSGLGQLSLTPPADSLIFKVMTYNVENLFDCRDDSLHADEEFLPTSYRHWTWSRYRRKLDAVARVIAAVGGERLPGLVALCEVEGDSVLRDLTRRSILRTAGYRHIAAHSRDVRGIDVALLYQPYLFRPVATASLHIKPPRDSRPTRDVLLVSGRLLSGDTLDVFVTHFPSRSGGAKATEPYRLLVAHRIHAAIDSLNRLRQRPQIIIMGDLNDYPRNASIRRGLEAVAPPRSMDVDQHTVPADTSSGRVSTQSPPQDVTSKSLHIDIDPHRLYHLLADKAATRRNWGSYKYQGEWGLLDHIIVSGNLLRPDNSLQTSPDRADVFTAKFLLTDDMRYGGQTPLRTYYGYKYLGGYSDHLPVWAEFTLFY